MTIYIVFFFSDYLEMYYPMHSIKCVVSTEIEAIELVDAENERLKKRQDYNKEQKAYFEIHKFDKIDLYAISKHSKIVNKG